MITKTLVKDLENLLKVDIDSTLFPYQKGKSIRIGHIVVRESSDEYKIFDTSTNAMVSKTFCKGSALAIARSLVKGNKQIGEILTLDETIKKNYIDCIFYKNTITNTKDANKKDIIKVRYEDARARTEVARQRLDKYIFD